MKYSSILFIISVVQSVVAQSPYYDGQPLLLPRLQDSTLITRGLNDILRKRTLSLQRRGSCTSSRANCGKESPDSSTGSQQRQKQQQYYHQDVATAQILSPPRTHVMTERTAPGAPQRSRSPQGGGSQQSSGSPRSTGSPRTETIIHSSSNSPGSSPRAPLNHNRGPFTTASSFETWLSRSTGSGPLPVPDPVPVAFDKHGRVLPKRGS